MKTQIQVLLLIVFLILESFNSLQAQDKYEFAIISFSPEKQNITISIGSNKYEVVETDRKNKIKDRNFNEVLAQVNKLQEQGWELFNTAVTGTALDIPVVVNYPYYLFYMRKKLQ